MEGPQSESKTPNRSSVASHHQTGHQERTEPVARAPSEWFKVSGNATRAEVELLRRAVDPVEGLKKQLMHAQDLSDALSRVRDLLGGQKLEQSARLGALATLEELANDVKQTVESRLAAWMLLRRTWPRQSTAARTLSASPCRRIKSMMDFLKI